MPRCRRSSADSTRRSGSFRPGLGRTRARKQVTGAALRRELEARGIVVRCPSNTSLAEEAPFAYKDVEREVGVVMRAGLARPVAQLRPIGVVKG